MATITIKKITTILTARLLSLFFNIFQVKKREEFYGGGNRIYQDRFLDAIIFLFTL